MSKIEASIRSRMTAEVQHALHQQRKTAHINSDAMMNRPIKHDKRDSNHPVAEQQRNEIFQERNDYREQLGFAETSLTALTLALQLRRASFILRLSGCKSVRLHGIFF